MDPGILGLGQFFFLLFYVPTTCRNYDYKEKNVLDILNR